MTQCLNLIYIAIKFHYDVLKGYLVMGCAKIILKINQRDVTPKQNEGEQPFLYVTCCLNLIYIAIKFHHYSPGPTKLLNATELLFKLP